ncbi:MAG: ParB/RepB/Spo0J family partition protein [Akkermansiaceae bacterium]|nr:ParB/RepB/Spo0J family partition protein [Akkermansiaceae bacterium]
MSKPVLGRGFETLLSPKPVALEGERVLSVETSSVVPSPLQPRRQFTPEQLDELTQSIGELGIIQPLIVRPVDGKYELIAGERRWRAACALGLGAVPVVVRRAGEREVLEMALIENLQRENLSPIEEARGYSRLKKEFKLKQEDIARRVGKSRAAVANTMRLLELAPLCQEMLVDGRITVGHAKVLLGVKDRDIQERIAQEIAKRSLTVRHTEKMVHNFLNPKPASPGERKPLPPIYEPFCRKLSKKFATPVTISPRGTRGTIEISYANRAELIRLIESFGLDASRLR